MNASHRWVDATSFSDRWRVFLCAKCGARLRDTHLNIEAKSSHWRILLFSDVWMRYDPLTHPCVKT